MSTLCANENGLERYAHNLRIVPFVGWILTEGTNFGINADYAMNGYVQECYDDFQFGIGSNSLDYTQTLKNANNDNGDLCGRQYVPPNPCNSNPCQNGASCTENGNYDFSCTCLQSGGLNVWTGKNCSTPLPCSDQAGTASSGPCQNGASCTNVDTDPLDDIVDYTCSCLSGFEGTNCENMIIVNPCDPNPCNTGSCTDTGSGNYVCTCLATHTGSNCESELPCTNSPCLNGATCSNITPYVDSNSYTCTCADSNGHSPGFTGTNCETQMVCAASNSPVSNICVPHILLLTRILSSLSQPTS